MREARPRIHLGAATDWLPRWLAVLFPITIAGTVIGQGILPPAPGFQGAPTVPQQGVPTGSAAQTQNEIRNEINGQPVTGVPGTPTTPGATATPPSTPEGEPGTEGEATGGAAAAIAPMKSLMQWGLLHVHATASYQFLYTTDVHSQPGESSDTITHTITPVVIAEIGPHVTLTYSPSFRFFSQKDFRDTVDQSVSLTAGAAYGDWSFGLSQSYAHTDEPLIETGQQTSQDTYDTSLSASYRVNDRISLDTILSLGLSDVNSQLPAGITNSALVSSRDYSGTEWANYQFTDAFNAGLGITVGYSEQNSGFRSMNEQYQARVNWNPGTKFTASLTGGANVEQFLDVPASDLVTPIYSASLGYHIFEQTLISINANRSTSASLFQNQVTDTTTVGIGLQQRLFGLLQFSAGFGYNTSTFKNTFGPLSTARTDDGESYTVGLGCPFLKRGNVSAFYEYTHNNSSESSFGFSSSQIGASISWIF